MLRPGRDGLALGGVPGTAAAWAANTLTPASTLRSANMQHEIAPKTSRIVQMK